METTNAAQGRLLVQLRQRFWHWYKSLQPNQQAYFNAFVLFVFYLPLRQFNWDVNKSFLGLAAVFWGMAMLADLLNFYKAIASTLLGKILLVGAFALGTNVAVANAAQVVNSFIGIDPGQFVHTITFTSLLIAPPLILALSIIALFFGASVITIFIMFHLLDEDSRVVVFPWYKQGTIVRYRGITAVVQFVSLIAIISSAYSWYQDGSSSYNDFLESKAKWFLYTFEMYQNAQCPLQEGQRVAFLGGDQVLIASKLGDEFSFVVQECVSAVSK